MANNCTIKLNSRKQICLCFRNSTPFIIEGKVINPPYWDKTGDYWKRTPICLELPNIEFDIKQGFKSKTFFDPIYCGKKIAAEKNLELAKFLDTCNNVLISYPETFTTAKEIGLFVLGGCKGESLNPTISLGEYIDIIIDRQKEKEENPDSLNYQVYITLKNALKDWENGNKLSQSINTLFQSDYDNLSLYLKERKGKNGKKGANWERMMQCYKAVINSAIKFKKITGCTEKNAVIFSSQNPNTQFKNRTGKTIVELYNEKNMKGALNFEQIKAFERLDPTTLCVKVTSTDRNNRKRKNNLEIEKVVLCYDILSFILYAKGMRPIDAIRIHHSDFDWEHNRIVYLPAKLKRFNNDDNDAQKHSVPVPINYGIKSIFEKYKDVNANGFLFPCPCNIKDNGKYDYKRINQFEFYMNAVIKAIGERIGLNFIPTNYTMRKTAITFNVDKETEKAKLKAMEKVAKMAGTSVYQIEDTYYKAVNH